MVEHLAGRVLCAGGRVGVHNNEGSGDLPPSDLWGANSSLWEDARDDALRSTEAPFPCRALGVLLPDNPQGLLGLPWVKMRTASPAPQSGGCVHSHLDLFQTPSEGHNQMALVFLLHLHIMGSLPSEPDNIPSAASGCGQCFHPWDGHCQLELVDDMAC